MYEAEKWSISRSKSGLISFVESASLKRGRISNHTLQPAAQIVQQLSISGNECTRPSAMKRLTRHRKTWFGWLSRNSRQSTRQNRARGFWRAWYLTHLHSLYRPGYVWGQ